MVIKGLSLHGSNSHIVQRQSCQRSHCLVKKQLQLFHFPESIIKNNPLAPPHPFVMLIDYSREFYVTTVTKGKMLLISSFVSLEWRKINDGLWENKGFAAMLDTGQRQTWNSFHHQEEMNSQLFQSHFQGTVGWAIDWFWNWTNLSLISIYIDIWEWLQSSHLKSHRLINASSGTVSSTMKQPPPQKKKN